jgi:hypothetical protein
MGRAAELGDICRKNRGSLYAGISVGGEISERQERLIRKSFDIPAAATLVAIIDGTTAQTSECGLVISDVGTHWVNPWSLKRVESRKTSLTWDEVATTTIARQGVMQQDITLGDGAVYSNSSGLFSTKKLVALLQDLQAAARAFLERRDRKPLPIVYVDFDSHALAELWTVAVNNKKGGPYGTSALQGFVAAGKVDPDTCLVWREGMDKWVAISSVPELIPAGGIPKRRPVAPPLPPAPPRTT